MSVLLLNASYEPLRVISWQRAITQVSSLLAKLNLGGEMLDAPDLMAAEHVPARCMGEEPGLSGT